MLLSNTTLLLPLLYIATIPDVHRVLERVHLASDSWLPAAGSGYILSLSLIDNPAYRGLNDVEMAMQLAERYDLELELPLDAEFEEGVPFTGGFLVLDNEQLAAGSVKAVGFDDGWDVYVRRPQNAAIEEGNLPDAQFSGEGWTQELFADYFFEIPSVFNLDQLPPTVSVFQDTSKLPHPPLPGTLNSHCLYWYLTSNGEKIGEFKEQALGSVIWEDSEGKEVIEAFLGRFCGPDAANEGEVPPPMDREESPKLVINRKTPAY